MNMKQKKKLNRRAFVKTAGGAVAAAIERDAASGNSILVSVIDKDGYQEIPKDTIMKIWKGP